MKQVPNTIKASTKYTTLIDHLSIGVVMISSDLTIIEKNRVIDEWFPIASNAEVDTKYCFQVLNCDSREGICDDCQTKRALDTGESVEVIKKKVTAKGTRDFKVVSTPIFDDKGEAIAVIETLEDITDQLQISSELISRQLFLKSLLDTVPIPIFYKDHDGKYMGCNAAFEVFFGKTQEEILHKSVFEINPSELAKIYHEQDLKLMKDGGEQTYQSFVKNAKGELRNVVFSKACILNSRGVVNGIIGAIQDITDLKLTEETLRQNESRLRETLTRFHQLAEQSKSVIWEVDQDGLYTYVSDNVETEWGYTPDEMISKLYYYDIYPEQYKEDFKDIGLNIIRNKQNITGLQNPIMTKNGEIKWVMSAGITIVDDDGIGVGFKGIDTDMTEQKQVEVALKKNQLFLSNLIEHSGTLICAKDRFGKYTLVNQKWEELTGLSRAETIGKTDLELFPTEIAKNFMANDREVMEYAKSIEVEEYLEDRIGRRTFLSVKFPMYDEKERIDGICAIITEITARKEAEERVRYLATHDYLTGLLGLRTLKEQMPLIQGIAQRHDEKVAIMFLDLDGFKAINDTYGHDAGDEVLKTVARRIKKGIRETDIASRIGGDEFVLLISSLHAKEEAQHIADKLKLSIEKPIKVNDNSTKVGVSIGISIFPDDGQDAETLVKIADSRMYDIKKGSR